MWFQNKFSKIYSSQILRFKRTITFLLFLYRLQILHAFKPAYNLYKYGFAVDIANENEL